MNTATAPSQSASFVTQTPAGAPAESAEHFASRLRFETDPSDLHHDLEHRVPGLIVVDARSGAAYFEGHIPGAISFPHRTMTPESTAGLSRDATYVSYCSGPGCNGSTRGALRLAELGFRVKELIGGLEYWQKEGYPVTTGESP